MSLLKYSEINDILYSSITTKVILLVGYVNKVFILECDYYLQQD